jgi:iron(III) transport system substrate-binding protein
MRAMRGGDESRRYSTAIMTAGGAMALAALLSNGVIAQPAAQPMTARYEPAAWEKIVAAARKEGRVHFYSVALPAATERMVSGFKKAYPGIEVDVFRNASAAVMPRIDQERASSADGADIVATTDFAWFSARAKEASFLAPVGPATRNWPPQFLTSGNYATVALELFVIPYNKNLVKAPPQGYADLLKPEFKGKVGTLEAGSQSVSSWYDWLEKTQGGDFLARLKDQNPKLYVSTAPLTQAIVAGEILAGVLGIGSSTKAMMATGAPMAYVVPNPAYASSYAIAALPWSRRPNSAQGHSGGDGCRRADPVQPRRLSGGVGHEIQRALAAHFQVTSADRADRAVRIASSNPTGC